MATAKLEICFDSGQFVDDTKNLQDQCAEVIYAPQSLSISLTLLMNFENFWNNATPTAQKFMPLLKQKIG